MKNASPHEVISWDNKRENALKGSANDVHRPRSTPLPAGS